MKLKPNNKYRWQFPIEIRFERWRWRSALTIICQPPVMRRSEIDHLDLSGFLNSLEDNSGEL